MASIRVRKETGKLFLDFVYKNKRCREQTMLDDTQANRRKLETVLKKIEAEIMLDIFDYAKSFPGSSNALKFQELASQASTQSAPSTPLFEEFADLWFSEMQIQWRRSHSETIALTIRKYLVPAFEGKEVGSITKAEILAFRSTLAKVTVRNDKSLSASRINKIMMPLRMIMGEAANRHNFSSPYTGIKSLKEPRTDVQPFTISEVNKIINSVRPDYKNYYLVRFFTGMRTSEVHGLQWEYVDFENRQILIRQALVRDELIYTKNDSSFRNIDMSEPVYQALLEQKKTTGQFEFVFCGAMGNHLHLHNVNNRVWYPLLRNLGLKERRPYQTRHTAGTLWLASGEAPEWIARQMGHTTTEMLFRIYSRYVPNLTRQDGSAFERLLAEQLSQTSDKKKKESTDA